jgi:hypothetical protein
VKEVRFSPENAGDADAAPRRHRLRHCQYQDHVEIKIGDTRHGHFCARHDSARGLSGSAADGSAASINTADFEHLKAATSCSSMIQLSFKRSPACARLISLRLPSVYSTWRSSRGSSGEACCGHHRHVSIRDAGDEDERRNAAGRQPGVPDERHSGDRRPIDEINHGAEQIHLAADAAH